MMKAVAVRVSILGSGSAGNCTVVSNSRTAVMFDAGFSRRETLRRMQAREIRAEEIRAIVISHEHSDHVAGLPLLARKLGVPVCLTALTRRALGEAVAELDRVETIQAGVAFTVGDLEITPFTIPHDACDPVAFLIVAEGVRIGLITDLGYLPENVKRQLRRLDCLVLESNHDIDLLKDGPYPWEIKQRVMSRVGHLSNSAVSDFLGSDEFDGAPADLVLAHLSEQNNTPVHAQIAAERALSHRLLRPRIHVASQSEPLPDLIYG
jgi:phosphoribosyl 1,2-cyclic phosphodiesterase